MKLNRKIFGCCIAVFFEISCYLCIEFFMVLDFKVNTRDWLSR